VAERGPRARLEVRVHPGARRAGLKGRMADGALKVEVAEPPEGGRANRAVEELVAEVAGVPRSRVTVVRGASARTKTVEVEGVTPEELERRVTAALGARSGREAGHGE